MENRNNLSDKIIANDDFLLGRYLQTGDIAFRDTVINNNIKLVKKIALKYAEVSKLDYEEIEAYGYEGLILAVNGYNPKVNKKFNSYAYYCIKNSIICGMPSICGFERSNFYYDFITCKILIEEEYGEELEDNLDLVDEIIDMMHEKNMPVPFSDLETKGRIKLVYHESLDSLEEENLVSDDIPFEIKVEQEEIYDRLKYTMGILSFREQDVLSFLYGLEDDVMLTQKEVSMIFDITPEGIRSIKERAFAKLRKSSLKRLHMNFAEDTLNNYPMQNLKLARKL